MEFDDTHVVRSDIETRNIKLVNEWLEKRRAGITYPDTRDSDAIKRYRDIQFSVLLKKTLLRFPTYY